MAGQISWAEIQAPGISATYDVRITGSDPVGSGTGFGADTFGVGVFSSNQIVSSVSYAARISSQSMSLRENDARIIGTFVSSGTYNARLTGRNVSNGVYDARLTSGNVSVIASDARLTARTTNSVSYTARLTSRNSTVTTFDTYLIGQASVQFGYDSRLTAAVITAVSYAIALSSSTTFSIAYAAAITGLVTQSSTSYSSRLTGSNQTATTYAIHATGQLSNAVSYSAAIAGSTADGISYSVRTTAFNTTQKAYDVRIVGGVPPLNAQFVVNIIGIATATTEMIAVIHGKPAPQKAYPALDIQTGNWHDAPLYDKIDEDSQNNTDYIESGINPIIVDVSEVKLTGIIDPGVSNDHIIRYAFSKDAEFGDTINLTIRLLQGNIEIATWTHNDISADVQTVAQTLTTSQADSIVDYTDLRLRFEAVTG